MYNFLLDIQACLEARIWSPAIVSLMVIPDACGAVEYPEILKAEGPKNAVRYRRWYDEYAHTVHSEHFRFDGEVVWAVRNGMIHETTLAFQRFGYDKLIFVPPDVHQVTALSINAGGEKLTVLYVPISDFAAGLLYGAERWLKKIAGDEKKLARLERLIQFRPSGIRPWAVGFPVVA